MMVCKHCGTTIPDDPEVHFCTNCGSPVPGEESGPTDPRPAAESFRYPQSFSAERRMKDSADSEDIGGCLWGLLGFCIPIAGLVLYLLWRNDRPNTAKSCGIGALISVALSLGAALIGTLIALVIVLA